MTEILADLGLKRPGLSFYGLRHTFETIAGATADQVTVDAVMGHVDASMAAEYREHIADARLQAVTEHVRNWLYVKSAGMSKHPSTKRKSTAKQKPPQATPVARTQQVSAKDRPQFRIVG